MALSRRASVTAFAALAIGAGLVGAPAASAATPQPATRCWLSCTTPTTAPAPAPLPVTEPVAAATQAPAPTAAPVVMVTKPPRPQLTGGEVAELLSLINRHRRSVGVGPVTLDPALTEIAKAHTATMIRLNLLHHNDSLFTRTMHQQLGIKLFAENVGYGSGVSDNNDGFLNSLHHRENMEGAAYTLVGLAVGRSSDGRIWVTEDFGTPRAGGTTAAARPDPRPATAPRTTTTTSTRRTTSAPRRAAAPAAPKPKAAAPRVLAAPPAIAQLAANPAPASAPVIDDTIDEVVTSAVTLAASGRSATAPIGAGVAVGLVGLGFLIVAPRRRKTAATR